MSGDTWPCGDPTCEREDCQPAARPAAGDSRTDRERVREAIVTELGRHGDMMRRNWSDNDADPVTVELGCRCGFVRGTVTAKEMAADLNGWLRKHREHVADAVLAVLDGDRG